jgi:hypothetical protein
MKNNFNSKQWWHEESKTSITYWDEEPYNIKYCIITDSNVASGQLAAVPGINLVVSLDNDAFGFKSEKYSIVINKAENVNQSVVNFIKNGGSPMMFIEYEGEQRGLGGDITNVDNVTRHTFTESGVYTP